MEALADAVRLRRQRLRFRIVNIADGQIQLVIMWIYRGKSNIAELSTYGYHRVWALLRKESEDGGAETVNAKRVHRVIRDNNLLLERKGTPVPTRAHNGKVSLSESDRRWSSDGFEFNCDHGDKLRSRSLWTVGTARRWTG